MIRSAEVALRDDGAADAGRHRSSDWSGGGGRAAGSPRPLGVLVDGEIVGAWRSRLKGSRLEVTVDPFARLSRTVRDAVTAEAEQVAPFRRCETARVTFAG